MKVLLITPPYHCGVVESAGVWLNVAFVYLAGALRARGHEAAILDAMSRFDDHAAIRAEIERQRPDMVCLTAITATVDDCVEVCQGAKEIDPRITTVLGNVHPTFMWRELLEQNPCVDLVVRGEGEHTLPELCDALQARGDLRRVAGLALRVDGVATTTPPRDRIDDLDPLPRAWELVDWPLYTYRPAPGSILAVLSSSRGCSQRCAFCSQQLFWNREWRACSAERFVDELEQLTSAYGVSVAMITDETPTLDRQRWERILDLLIERRLGVELLLETRVADVLRDEDILERYARAGVSHVYLGVEAVSQDMLDTFKKEISVAESKRAIELINQHDMISETSFVLGMPDDTPERMQATLELAKHYAPDLAFFLAIAPWPYADIYPQLEPYIAVRDYRRYNLVEAVVAPTAMRLEQVNAFLASASRDFYVDRFMHIHRLTPAKRDFLVRVTKILMEHSYLGAHMKAAGSAMPAWVDKLLSRG